MFPGLSSLGIFFHLRRAPLTTCVEGPALVLKSPLLFYFLVFRLRSRATWPTTSTPACSLPHILITCRCATVDPHFLPFFFFFPPPVPAVAGTGTPPILTSPCSSTFGAATPASCGALRSSMASGSAAISLPNLPRLLMSLPTSAPLVVSYCKHVPDTGSYVFRTKVAVTSVDFDCGGGGDDDVRDVSAVFDACLAA